MLENKEILVKGAKKTRHKGGGVFLLVFFFFGLEDVMEIPIHRTSGADEEMCCLPEVCISYIGISGNIKATNFPTLFPNLYGY